MNNGQKKGFTLIELIVYIGIFIILITIVTVFAVNFLESSKSSQIKKEVILGVYTAMKSMLHEIKSADSIYVPTSVFENSSGQLSLSTLQDLPDGEILTYLDFYLDDRNKLYVKREGRDPEILISEKLKVTNLNFIKISSNSVKISLTLEYDTENAKYQKSFSLSSTASIRK